MTKVLKRKYEAKLEIPRGTDYKVKKNPTLCRGMDIL